jgi:hypothetical protein
MRHLRVFCATLLALAFGAAGAEAQIGTVKTQSALSTEFACTTSGCITPTQMQDLIVSGIYGVGAGLTAAGSTQGTCLALTTQVNDFTTVGAGTGACLPSAVAGQTSIDCNSGANPLFLYPASGAAIGANGTNNPVVIPAGQCAGFSAVSSSLWQEWPAGQNIVAPTGVEAIDHPNLQAAVNASGAGGLPAVLIPGTYNICHTITGPGNEMVIGAGEVYVFGHQASPSQHNNIIVKCSGTNAFTPGKSFFKAGNNSLYANFSINGISGAASSTDFMGYIGSGGALTVTAVNEGTIAIGQYLLGTSPTSAGPQSGTEITGGSGTSWTTTSPIAVGASYAPAHFVASTTGVSCIDVTGTDSVTVNNMVLANCDHGVDMGDPTDTTTASFHLYGGVLANNIGLGVNCEQQCNDWYVDNANINSNGLGGIFVGYSGLGRIQNNRIEDNPASAITSLAGGILISNNQFDENGGGVPGQTFPTIFLGENNAANVQIENNMITHSGYNYGTSSCNSGSVAIEIATSTWQATLAGNTFDTCVTYTYQVTNAPTSPSLVADTPQAATAIWNNATTEANMLPIMKLNRPMIFSGTIGGAVTALPTCGGTLSGITELVSDGYAWASSGNGVPGSTYAGGNGSTQRSVRCNGSNWVYN